MWSLEKELERQEYEARVQRVERVVRIAGLARGNRLSAALAWLLALLRHVKPNRLDQQAFSRAR